MNFLKAFSVLCREGIHQLLNGWMQLWMQVCSLL